MIAPVFAYRWQKWLFCITLVFFLALPYLPKPGWMDRAMLYHFAFSKKHMSNIYTNILDAPGDIDVLVLGSSSLGSGLNPLIIRAALRATTGKESNVAVMFHPNAGFDLDYVILKDVLAKKKVKLLIWDALRMPDLNAPINHYATSYLWDMRLHEDLLDITPKRRTTIYLYSVMTGLKLILSPVLDHGKSIPEPEGEFMCDKPYYLGACLRKEANQLKKEYPPPPMLDMNQILHFRDDVTYLSPRYHYRRTDGLFYEQVLKLAQDNGVQVAFMITPMVGGPSKVIPIQEIESGSRGWNVPIIGATRKEVQLDQGIKNGGFYQTDGTHMLYNATNYYTRIVLPAIIRLYEQTLAGGIQPPPSMDEMGNYYMRSYMDSYVDSIKKPKQVDEDKLPEFPQREEDEGGGNF